MTPRLCRSIEPVASRLLLLFTFTVIDLSLALIHISTHLTNRSQSTLVYLRIKNGRMKRLNSEDGGVSPPQVKRRVQSTTTSESAANGIKYSTQSLIEKHRYCGCIFLHSNIQKRARKGFMEDSGSNSSSWPVWRADRGTQKTDEDCDL